MANVVQQLPALIGVAVGDSSEEEELFALKWTQTGDFLRRDLRADATYDESKAAVLFARFVKNGTWQCPTLVVNRSGEHFDDGIYMHKEWLKYIRSDMRDLWKKMGDDTVKSARHRLTDSQFVKLAELTISGPVVKQRVDNSSVRY